MEELPVTLALVVYVPVAPYSPYVVFVAGITSTIMLYPTSFASTSYDWKYSPTPSLMRIFLLPSTAYQRILAASASLSVSKL